MKRYRNYIMVLLCGYAWGLQGQLSPGKLTNAHAAYEGTTNCTLCHDLGKKVSNTKCLECHDILQARVEQDLGYHASVEVKGKDCFTCHSEHHGREFEMIRFDEKAFDHNLTGYPLTGAHKTTDCRACHQPDFIDNSEIRAIQNTFLGLSEDCLSCHEDYHQQTLGADCASCHTTEEFTGAAYFDHSESAFPLKGAHKEVSCVDCHPIETRQDKDFQVFSGIPFNNCNSCHEDVHQGDFGKNCASCHNERSFQDHRGLAGFNHVQTGFPLKGSHIKVDCAGCHNLDAGLATLFKDYPPGLPTNACAQCHDDVHENKFGNACAECHNEDAFRGNIDTDNFNHALTGYELEGKHFEVSCVDCHGAVLTDPLPHQTCLDCHEDFHEGVFVAEVPPGIEDCASCHTVEGFDLTLFDLDRHQQTAFPLDGAHLATPCFACHLNEETGEWEFRQIGQTCVDCHDNVHATAGEIPEKYYPTSDCTVCHVTDDWSSSVFDHSQTAFTLEGKHLEVSCVDCHFVAVEQRRVFSGTEATCFSCHDDQHYEQFVDDSGQTDCRSCHGFDNWEAVYFSHDNSAFPLDGKHREVACEACHQPVTVGEATFIQYKFNSFECVDCHN